MTNLRKNRFGWPQMPKQKGHDQDSLDYELKKLEVKQERGEYLAMVAFKLGTWLLIISLVSLLILSFFYDIESIISQLFPAKSLISIATISAFSILYK